MSQEHGYAGNILRVDLSSATTWQMPTADYADFVGGRGMAAKIYWKDVSPQTKAFDPENQLIFATGPFAGFAGFGSSRWQVYGKSPTTDPEQFCYCNMGGTWGVALKFAGYDAVVIQGKADKPTYILIQDGSAKLGDASHLWGRGGIETRERLKSELGPSTKVVACGQAGENMVVGAILLADKDSSGSGGLGAVMGSKRLKAIAITGGRKKPVAAYPDKVQELVKYFHCLIGNKDKLLHSDEYYAQSGPELKKDYCWGCAGPCTRRARKAVDGIEGKFFCQSAMVYQARAQKYYQGQEGDVPYKVTKLCDDYGLDTKYVNAVISWLSRCYRRGIFTEQETGLPLSKEGSMEYATSLLHKISYREDFGDILAQGVSRAAELTGKGMSEIGDLIHKAGVDDIYGPRLYIVNGLIYAMEPRQPMQQLHETIVLVEQWLDWLRGTAGAYVSSRLVSDIALRFWGSRQAGDFSSHEGKALAAKMIQDREYIKECLILCDMLWPVMASPNTKDHIGDATLESKLFTAITGKEMDEDGLYLMGEKVFNLQRAILAREGHVGRQNDSLPEFSFNTPLKQHVINPECLVPGSHGEPISRKGAVVDREKFEQVKSEYYHLRGWDVSSGRPTKHKLEKLGLKDIADDLQKRGLLA